MSDLWESIFPFFQERLVPPEPTNNTFIWNSIGTWIYPLQVSGSDLLQPVSTSFSVLSFCFCPSMMVQSLPDFLRTYTLGLLERHSSLPTILPPCSILSSE